MQYDAVLLIPAYKPDEKLLKLLDELSSEDSYKNIVIVDDGSGREFNDIFKMVKSNRKCTLLTHEVNKGKGCALKTGILYCIDKYSEDRDFSGIITADADGQHTVKDINRMAKALDTHRNRFIIGTRIFDKNTPLRSKFGNSLTAFIYKIISGVKINDTQTGLRGLPATSLQKMAEVNGDRYEYEMNVLLSLGKMKLSVFEVPIKTVYIDENKSSHFNPLIDSLKIYSKIFKFALSSILSFLLDYIIYWAAGFFIHINAAYITGKVLSSVFNFFLNKQFVFKSDGNGKYLKEIISYYSLFLFNLILGVLFNALLIKAGVPKYISKLIGDTVIFILSYYVQKLLIFKHKI